MRYLLSFIIIAIVLSGCDSATQEEKGMVAEYVRGAHLLHKEAQINAHHLHSKIKDFLANPSDKSLRIARQHWYQARNHYARTRVLKMIGEPIDLMYNRLDAYKIDISYLDYTEQDKSSGITNRKNIEITVKNIRKLNQTEGKTKVTIGWNALAFLLWGEKRQRLADDYTKQPKNERRRLLLKAVTSILVEDIDILERQWRPDTGKYADYMLHSDTRDRLHDVFASIYRLAHITSREILDPLIQYNYDVIVYRMPITLSDMRDIKSSIWGAQILYLSIGGYAHGYSLHRHISQRDAYLANYIKSQMNLLNNLFGRLGGQSINYLVDQFKAHEKSKEKKNSTVELVLDVRRVMLTLANKITTSANYFNLGLLR